MKNRMLELNSMLNENKLNEAHGDELHMRDVIDDIMDIVDEIQIDLEVNIHNLLKHHDAAFLGKLSIERTILKGMNHQQIRRDIETMIRKEWGK
jgi:hypothetical protein